MTGDLVSTIADHSLLRYDGPACVDRYRAPGVEPAARWWVDGRRQVVTEQHRLARSLLGRVRYGRGREQRLGIGVSGCAEDACAGALLDQLTQVHHRDLVCQVLDG